MSSQLNVRHIQQVAAIAIGFAGVLHIVTAPAHWQHAPAHGLFFVIAGLVQIAWAVAFIRRPSPHLSYAGLVMAVGLVALWGMTRLLPAPFGHGPEEVDAAGLACKLSETVGALALALLVYQAWLANSGRAAAWRALAAVMVVSLVLGGIGYGVARASEPLFPALAAPHEAEEDHHDEDTHGEMGAATEFISASTLEERLGIRVTLIGVTAAGGLIDFRFKVLDSQKAAQMLEDPENLPELIVEESGTTLVPPAGAFQDTELETGQIYYMLYPNPRGAIQPGMAVSVVIGDAHLEPILAQ
jgi:hypothetical protein